MAGAPALPLRLLPPRPGRSDVWAELAGRQPAGRYGSEFDALEAVRELGQGGGFAEPRAEARLAAGCPLHIWELDFSRNPIGDRFMRELVEALLGADVHLRVLKLHHCRVGRCGAAACAQLLQHSVGPLAELHLSHNYLHPLDVFELLAAVIRRPAAERSLPPLWLRVEHQQVKLWDGFDGTDDDRWRATMRMIATAEERLASVRADAPNVNEKPAGPLLCVVGERTCTPGHCIHAHANGPLVHLPHFWRQLPKDERTAVQIPREALLHEEEEERDRIQAMPRETVPVSHGLRLRDVGGERAKEEPSVIMSNAELQVLAKPAYWLCHYGGHKQHACDRNEGALRRDMRDTREMVESCYQEHMDLYAAKAFKDEAASLWWEVERSDHNMDKWTAECAYNAGLVHRLDGETSGCLVRARSKRVFGILRSEFHRHQVRKTYLALVHGDVEWARPGGWTLIDDRIAHCRSKNCSTLDNDWGDDARTWVRPLRLLRCTGTQNHYSLCEVEIETGRTHQIRVHLSGGSRRAPLVGDAKYGWHGDRSLCSRLWLHHVRVQFKVNDKRFKAVAPIPADLRNVLDPLYVVKDHVAAEDISALLDPPPACNQSDVGDVETTRSSSSVVLDSEYHLSPRLSALLEADTWGLHPSRLRALCHKHDCSSVDEIVEKLKSSGLGDFPLQSHFAQHVWEAFVSAVESAAGCAASSPSDWLGISEKEPAANSAALRWLQGEEPAANSAALRWLEASDEASDEDSVANSWLESLEARINRLEVESLEARINRLEEEKRKSSNDASLSPRLSKLVETAGPWSINPDRLRLLLLQNGFDSVDRFLAEVNAHGVRGSTLSLQFTQHAWLDFISAAETVR